MRRFALIVGFLIAFAVPAWAGFEEGRAAYERGDYATALKEWRLLAEQGDATAQFNLGQLYDSGLGVKSDLEQALEWYKRAAEQGHADAQVTLAELYRYGRDWYLYGWFPLNPSEAVKWYRKAARQGNIVAQYALGEMYEEGEGNLQHYGEAAKFYRQAAEQGDDEAQYRLAGMYREGKGVAKDYVQAHMWYNLAAAQWYSLAKIDRDALAELMTPAQIAEAQRLASEWKPKSE